ncbi:MAG: ATP-binding cassette domain-containing protein [Firmicutes bacterium]|nr:ATP-binding cassette domain-containing protein [Bacillota bacterium]
MKKAIELHNVTFSYTEDSAILKNVSYEQDYGEFVVLQGISGEGKTTFLSVINGIIPHINGGDLEGKIFLDGEDVTELSAGKRARLAGSVLQNADDQIVDDKAEDEVAFGCENLNIPINEMKERVSSSLEKMMISPEVSTRTLSGGQKQRLITAAALAMGQRIILLDEPLANLDRESAVFLLRTLKELTQSGYAVLIVEHRLDLVLPFADKVYSISEGEIILEKDPQKILTHNQEIIPYDNEPLKRGKTLIETSNIEYAAGSIPIIRGVSLNIREGERITILGANGCGKTTLLKLLARLIYPTGGGYLQNIVKTNFLTTLFAAPSWFKKAGYVYQNPSYQLFMPTVREEIGYRAASKERAERMIEMFGLRGLEERHPHSLSEGQKRRTGVAAVCACDPKILFLDEPTVGQDFENLKLMVNSIRTLQKESGFAVVTVTHDIRCKDALSDRKITMKLGKTVQ